MTRTLCPPAALCTVVMVALIGAGCGGTQSSSGTSTAAGHAGTASHTTTVTAREKAVKFSECMRANGVGAFPDPDAYLRRGRPVA